MRFNDHMVSCATWTGIAATHTTVRRKEFPIPVLETSTYNATPTRDYVALMLETRTDSKTQTHTMRCKFAIYYGDNTVPLFD